jgi:hypothetical protein
VDPAGDVRGVTVASVSVSSLPNSALRSTVHEAPEIATAIPIASASIRFFKAELFPARNTACKVRSTLESCQPRGIEQEDGRLERISISGLRPERLPDLLPSC